VTRTEPDGPLDPQLEIVDGRGFIEGGGDLRQCGVDGGALSGARCILCGAHAFASARGTRP